MFYLIILALGMSLCEATPLCKCCYEFGMALRETLPKRGDESNTIRIASFFFGWYIPNIGRYHLSLESGISVAFSACPLCSILSIKSETCSLLVGLYRKERSNDRVRFMACGLLLGSGDLLGRNGRGATQCPSESLWKPHSIFRKVVSSMEGVILSSWSVFRKTTSLMVSKVETLRDAHRSTHTFCVLSLHLAHEELLDRPAQ